MKFQKKLFLIMFLGLNLYEIYIFCYFNEIYNHSFLTLQQFILQLIKIMTILFIFYCHSQEIILNQMHLMDAKNS